MRMHKSSRTGQDGAQRASERAIARLLVSTFLSRAARCAFPTKMRSVCILCPRLRPLCAALRGACVRVRVRGRVRCLAGAEPALRAEQLRGDVRDQQGGVPPRAGPPRLAGGRTQGRRGSRLAAGGGGTIGTGRSSSTGSALLCGSICTLLRRPLTPFLSPALSRLPVVSLGRAAAPLCDAHDQARPGPGPRARGRRGRSRARGQRRGHRRRRR